nr:MAG TPA: hypothetical protein [Caudoviricetes sp.]
MQALIIRSSVCSSVRTTFSCFIKWSTTNLASNELLAFSVLLKVFISTPLFDDSDAILMGLIAFVNPVHPSDAAEGQFKRGLSDAVIVDGGYTVQGMNHGNNPFPVFGRNEVRFGISIIRTEDGTMAPMDCQRCLPKIRRHRSVGVQCIFLFFRQYDDILKQYVQAVKDEVEGVLGLLGAVEGVHLIFTPIVRIARCLKVMPL